MRTVLRAARRSLGEPIDRGVQVYIGDTMGELGLFYRLSSVIFVGKSLAGQGGQNPIEPAKLGSAILHGPHVGNFIDVYAALDEKGGAIKVDDEASLARALASLFTDPALLRRTAEASRETVGELGGASDKIMQALEHYIAHMIVSEQ